MKMTLKEILEMIKMEEIERYEIAEINKENSYYDPNENAGDRD